MEEGSGTRTLKATNVAPAHRLEEVGPFDTLAIDCEGCFATFFEENPGLESKLKLIILETHGDKEEKKLQQMLASKRWKLLQVAGGRQHVLCAADADCPVYDPSC